MALFNRKQNTEEGVPVKNRQPTNEEQMARRQSAPRPTVQDAVAQMAAQHGAGGVTNGFDALEKVIGREQVKNAYLTLQKYKEGKHNLERKIVDNEQWYKVRHWECMRGDKSDVQPASAWLFNCIANKHADAMDNFPSPNILPREEGDKSEAEMLTSIVPVILDQCEFEQTYSDVWMYKLKTGTGVYGVFWNKEKMNGLGDVDIRKIDLINLFWESGITDIQKSRNVFHVELADNDILKSVYPELEGKLGGQTLDIAKYVYDDKVDTTNKTAVIDWYYKKNVGGRTVLHYCKFVNDVVLFATENDPKFKNGWYDHGQYPFVFDTMFPVEGTPCGFGYIDVGKDAQEYIDRGNQAIMMNMLANAKPRYFINTSGDVNEEEYANPNKDFIHVGGNLGQDSIVPAQGKPLSSIYVQVINNKIDELKETTSNRDVAQGGTTGGVTAASGVAAMQEASSKQTRDHNKSSYRSFRKICLMIIELIRQFYDLPRCFRIMGENGAARYVQYSNAGIQPQQQGGLEMGVDMGYRLPLFDIEVTAQKQSPYSKMSQNELALQFYSAGFFNPQMADQALACLDMMDFDRKQFIIQKVAQNGGMYQQMLMMQKQMLMLAQMVDQYRGSNFAEQIAAWMNGGQPVVPRGGDLGGNVEKTEALGGEETKEPAQTKKARQRVAESTSPT